MEKSIKTQPRSCINNLTFHLPGDCRACPLCETINVSKICSQAAIRLDGEGKRIVNDPVVITAITGGIGNQMFQYACGRSVALRRNAALKLDLSWYRTQHDRVYKLAPFHIKASIATDEECRQVRHAGTSFASRLAARLFGSPNQSERFRSWYREPRYFAFHEWVLEGTGSVYLDGYWQNMRYFRDVANSIREDLALAAEPSPSAAKIASQMEMTTAVSVHFRRGDYVSDPAEAKLHGACGPEYYMEAVSLIRKTVPDMHLFCFSDDPHWVTENADLPPPFTIVPPGHAPQEDLWLMSRARHHVIANSSFSWWGAWLSANPKAMVCCPRRWIADSAARPEFNPEEFFPEHWIQL